MKAKEYGAWLPKNVTSGWNKKPGDGYNLDLKKINYVKAEEFACRDVEEYYHVDEQKDYTKEDDEKDSQQKEEEAKRKSSQKARMARQRVLQQVVALVVGSVVIVTNYQAMVEREKTAPGTDPGHHTVDPHGEDDNQGSGGSTAWKWSDDNTSAVITITDKDGNTFDIEAPVTTSTVEATCTAEGSVTYTASAEKDGKTYSDKRIVTLPALGHNFGAGVETVLDTGQTALDFECETCHEHFIIATSISEN